MQSNYRMEVWPILNEEKKISSSFHVLPDIDWFMFGCPWLRWVAFKFYNRGSAFMVLRVGTMDKYDSLEVKIAYRNNCSEGHSDQSTWKHWMKTLFHFCQLSFLTEHNWLCRQQTISMNQLMNLRPFDVIHSKAWNIDICKVFHATFVIQNYMNRRNCMQLFSQTVVCMCECENWPDDVSMWTMQTVSQNLINT